MAERFSAAGYSLLGYDIDREARDRFQALGGQPVRSPREVAIACWRIILCLPNYEAAARVIAEMLPVAWSASIIIDTTTGLPEHMVKLAKQVAVQDIGYLDATIGGSSEQVRSREAIIMAGGEKHYFNECREIFSCISREAYHVGPIGSGAEMKLAVNLVLGLNRAALAEGLKYAEVMGLDPEDVLKVLKDSPAYSKVMDTKGDKMLNQDFEPQAKLSQHLKDVNLMLKTGLGKGAKMPLTQLHKRILKKAVADGYGEEDNSAVIKVLDKNSQPEKKTS